VAAPALWYKVWEPRRPRGVAQSVSFFPRTKTRVKMSGSSSKPEDHAGKLAERVRQFFGDRMEVDAVYLFGSAARGELAPLSDVDLGLLYAAGFVPSFEQLGLLKTDLADALGREADLVDLGAASAILRMQVLRKGRLLLNRNPRAVNRFFVRTLNEYFDLKQVRRPIEISLSRARTDG